MSWQERAACRGLPPALFFPDVGQNATTAKQVHEAGATVLVAGNAVFKAKNYADAIRAIRG